MGGVRGGTILYCTPPNLPLWGGTLENKVHQKTVFVQFGLASFGPIKIGKSWIASDFCPRNDEKHFRPKRTKKYKSQCLSPCKTIYTQTECKNAHIIIKSHLPKGKRLFIRKRRDSNSRCRLPHTTP